MAVYLVVLFHAGSQRFVGGFIGVDVFFVLSGYLVTQVLLRDLDATGSIRFGRFYARRVRRLLPAALIVLLVTATVYTAIGGPAQVAEATGALQAALLYVSNWYFVGQATDYFAGDVNRSPVLHFWSLAVEEQFYLLWPLLLAGAVRATRSAGRHRATALKVLVAGAALASVSWAVVLRSGSPDRAYFGTDTRAYQLLAGALLALSPSIIRIGGRFRRTSQVAGVVATLAIVALSSNRVLLDPIERGIAVTAAALALIIALDADVGGPVKRAFSLAPVDYLGRISYGTYLWHWPVIIAIENVVDLDTLPLAAATALASTGIASLSYQLVEMPIRRAAPLDRFRWPVVAAGLAFSLLAALVVVPRVNAPASSTANAAATKSTAGFTPVPASFDLAEIYYAKFGETVDCVDQAPEACTVVRGDGPHLLLMGDSNAEMWIPALEAMARTEGVTLSLAVTAGCLWQRDAYKLGEEIKAACRRTKTDAYDRVIPALDPDLIVLINSREPKGPAGTGYSDSSFDQTLRRSTKESVAELGKGRQLLIVEPAPTPTDPVFNPLDCLDDADVVEECRFAASTATGWLVEEERTIARGSDSIATADFSRLICPFFPICDPIVDDKVVFWNGQHIASAYSRTLGDDVGRYLKQQGLIPP